MTAALALMASERGDVRFVQQSMYYPVTDAAMDTESYEQFAEGYFLAAKGMAWFWDAYLPDLERRSEPYASPLRASDEQLAGLPPAFVIVDEADVLRDEGEAYAARLRAAGVRGHDRPLRRHHARLHDAQPAQRHARHARRGRTGHLGPARRAVAHPTVDAWSRRASFGGAAWPPDGLEASAMMKGAGLHELVETTRKER